MTTSNTSLSPLPRATDEPMAPVSGSPVSGGRALLPAMVGRADERTQKRFLEFFAATIRNRNTRQAYYRAVCKFCEWCERRGVREMAQVEPLLVAAFIEEETARYEAQTVKQELAALRKLFDFLVTGGSVPFNPAASVRGPSYSIDEGKTPVLTREQARALLASIP